MIYIAAPYSSGLPTVVESRLVETTKFVMTLLSQGVPAFSPVLYFHPLAMAMGLPTDAGHWHNHNMQFLRKADAMFVLRLTGWDQSKGVQIETKIAKALGMQVVHFGPDFQPVQ